MEGKKKGFLFPGQRSGSLTFWLSRVENVLPVVPWRA